MASLSSVDRYIAADCGCSLRRLSLFIVITNQMNCGIDKRDWINEPLFASKYAGNNCERIFKKCETTCSLKHKWKIWYSSGKIFKDDSYSKHYAIRLFNCLKKLSLEKRKRFKAYNTSLPIVSSLARFEIWLKNQMNMKSRLTKYQLFKNGAQK